jgi:hypothetical protein
MRRLVLRRRRAAYVPPVGGVTYAVCWYLRGRDGRQGVLSMLVPP